MKTKMHKKNWNEKATEQMTVGERIADNAAKFIGSWKFIIGQGCLMVVWVIVNVVWAFHFMQFDPYPFVFMNLFMSAEAAFSTPLIMMSQNRQADRDKVQAEHQYEHQEKELALNTEVTQAIHEMVKQNTELTQAVHDAVTKKKAVDKAK